MKLRQNPEEELKNWFRQLLSVPVPAPAAPLCVEKIRYWRADHPPTALPGEHIVSRHPALRDVLPEITELPVSRSKPGWGRGRQCRLPSWKGGHVLRLFSTLELDHAMNCELDPAIERIVEQPLKLRYENKRGYTPDAYVLASGRPEIREIKLEHDAAASENESRWPLIAKAFNSMGFDFRVLTQASIRSPQKFTNVKRIFAHRLTPVPCRSSRIYICEFLESSGACSFEHLKQKFPSLSFEQVLALVRHGFLSVDLTGPIDEHTSFLRGRRARDGLIREERFDGNALL
ncbi:TnsA endonuclease N-terminal domain-containing protein [Bosea sp. BK604]|uniref:TnsA endonuclease N-terminal domain-containing protein n=1 Tax=Bosea sp. BK604 TaxID=2512180 RepID=UPI00104ED2D8|nr:TnsA endonuclease N-terminal domain-containing protein [Bosea sp. BK604]TCR68178.1 hypothetical protein EV560_1024 [Bosea sp. BK604]